MAFGAAAGVNVGQGSAGPVSPGGPSERGGFQAGAPAPEAGAPAPEAGGPGAGLYGIDWEALGAYIRAQPVKVGVTTDSELITAEVNDQNSSTRPPTEDGRTRVGSY